MPSAPDLPVHPRGCPIFIPPNGREEHRRSGELSARAQSLVVDDWHVEAVVARLALNKEDRHLPTSPPGILVEVGQSPVLLEAGSNLVHDALYAERVHRRWLLVVGERWWRVEVRG